MRERKWHFWHTGTGRFGRQCSSASCVGVEVLVVEKGGAAMSVHSCFGCLRIDSPKRCLAIPTQTVIIITRFSFSLFSSSSFYYRIGFDVHPFISCKSSVCVTICHGYKEERGREIKIG